MLAETATSAPAPKSSGSSDLDALWTQLLEAVGRVSQFTRGYLLEAHPVSLTNKLFTIGFDPEFADQMELVNNQKTHAILQTKLHELGHSGAQIKFIVAESSVPRAKPAAEPAPVVPSPVPAAAAPTKSAATTAPAKKPEPVALNADEFKNDPLIQKALEIFKGTIVEVRA